MCKLPFLQIDLHHSDTLILDVTWKLNILIWKLNIRIHDNCTACFSVCPRFHQGSDHWALVCSGVWQRWGCRGEASPLPHPAYRQGLTQGQPHPPPCQIYEITYVYVDWCCTYIWLLRPTDAVPPKFPHCLRKFKILILMWFLTHMSCILQREILNNVQMQSCKSSLDTSAAYSMYPQFITSIFSNILVP